MKLGAHLSIAGDINNAIEDAKKIRANTLQIFSGPPRNWKTPKRSSLKLKRFRDLARKNKISPIFVHAKYLINVASENPIIRKKSIASLTEDLNFCQKIGARGVIFHPHPKNLKILNKSLKQILNSTPKSTWLILENSAQMKLEKIGQIIKTAKNKRVKFCLDIAHAFQAGYKLNKVFEIIKKSIGFKNWVAIHANDSKTNQGSKNDRHENIGQGKIGTEPFFIFLNHPITSKLPFIIETPAIKTEGLAGDIKNLNTLKKLVGQKLDKKFYHQPTLKVAKKLLGKYLFVVKKNTFKIGKIIETEAYIGFEDKASHASRGKTPRTKIMFGPAGKLYIYLIYGMYHCLNIVTERRGYPAAVLIRAVKPVFGIKEKTDGPGKLCREFGLSKKDTGIDITKDKKIFIKDLGTKPKKITATPRIGVEYAGKWTKKKWRFLSY